VARVHLDGGDVAELFDRAVGTLHAVRAELPRTASGHSERRDDSPVAEDARRHGSQEAQPAGPAVAAAPLPGTAAPAPDAVALESHREAELEDFWVGQPRVGHVGLHHRGPVEAGPRARSPADGLVVLVLGIAE